MDTPLISIIVATYNREKYITQAISSIQKQTYQNWELIIVDDASTDKTEDVVMEIVDKDKRIQYIQQKENVGIARNRNTGLDKAKGEYVAILDSDDFWIDPEKLKKQVAFLSVNKEHALVGTCIKTIDAEDRMKAFVDYHTSDENIRKAILFRNQFAQSSVLYRTSVIKALGGYDATYTVNDDYDLWLKVGLTNKFANLQEYSIGYRIHPGGITSERKLLAADEHIRIIRTYKKNYPGYQLALLKGYARMILALAGF